LSDPRLIDRPVGLIAYEVGFDNHSYFDRAFRRHFGITPSDVRAQANDVSEQRID
jgi:AraC-like DNA-binding protein